MGANGSKDISSRSSSLQSIHLKNKPQDLVDFGTVFPNGLYSTTPQDFDSRKLRQLILTRKISPFYTGLPDAPEQVAAPSHLPKLQPSTSLSPSPSPNVSHHGRPRSASNRSDKMSRQGERESSHIERMKIQKTLYNDAVECPICFLYYPPNINYSRCCDQPICTECFIQIHRPTDDPSSPATCPFCLESNYGVTYVPPAWAEKPKRLRSFSSSSSLSTSYASSLPPSPSSGARHTTSGVSDGVRPRRKSISHTDPTVVLIDHVRPNWNKPPAPSASSGSTRRNSLSSSGTTTSSAGRNLLRVVTRPGRSASSAASTEYSQYLTTVRDMNMDLEEWMVMEAIRLSLSEQQEEQARNNNNNNNSNGNGNAPLTSSSTVGSARSAPLPPLPPLPQQSTTNQAATATTVNENNRNGGRADDDQQPLALRVQQYQQDTFYSSPSITSSTSSSELSLENQECALDKKSANEHETAATTSPTSHTRATTTATSTADIVC